MKVEGKSTRYYERRNLKIPLEFFYRETADDEWSETAFTDQVTICGVGLTISRIVEPKRLIRLKMPMPKSYRLFDFNSETYEVWGLIRYLQILEPETPGKIRLKAGISLIGKNPPASFRLEPKTLYDLKPILKKQSFWELRELPRRMGPFGRLLEFRRPLALNAILETIDREGNIIEAVEANTLNISESGAAVRIDRPDFRPSPYALIRTGDGKVSLLAAVRGLHRLENESFRLHLEFISGKWLT